jgi:Fur family ferric uptake transcriptional regulator
VSAVDQPRPRRTRQREAVATYLRGHETFLSAQEIWAGLRDEGSTIGLATVYRAVQALVDDGEIDALRTDDGESVYRHCGAGHHHHLVCRRCGRTLEVEGPAVERWAAKVAAEHGFADVEHTVEIFGTCDQH